MWLVRLVVVLAAVGGGLAWWTLGGDGAPTIEADQESCTKGAAVTDVDYTLVGHRYKDGDLHSVTHMSGSISGKNLHLVTEPQVVDGQQRERKQGLWLDGDYFTWRGGDNWEYIPRERLIFPDPPCPINAEIICPNLTHLTFAIVEDVDGQGTKKFTAPTLSGEPYDKPVGYGDPDETRDLEMWIDDHHIHRPAGVLRHLL